MLVKKTQAFVKRQSLWREGASLVVAVSGGADSLALLDILVHLQPKYRLKLRIAHVNYRLRGADSDRDEQLVRQAAKQYGIPCSILRPRVSTTANLESHLRDIRYAFFSRIRKRYRYDAIVTAHTLDDQAETVLLRLLQGSGLRGLRGMLPQAQTLVRPFLWAKHHQLVRYCNQYGIVFGEDFTNQDTSLVRNRIRHQLLPFLRQSFVPHVEEVLARNAEVLGQEYNQECSLRAFFREHTPWMREASFTRREWQQLRPEEQSLWLQEWCRVFQKTLSYKQSSEVLRYLQTPSWKKKQTVIGGLKIVLKDGRMSLTLSSTEARSIE